MQAWHDESTHRKVKKTHKSTIRLLSHVPTVLGLPEGGAFSILYRAASVHLARKASQVMLVGLGIFANA